MSIHVRASTITITRKTAASLWQSTSLMEFSIMLSDWTRGPALRPAIVVDGTHHALSVARNLVRHGVTVYALTGRREGVRFSRHVRWIRMADGGSPHSWERFLLGPDSD